MTVYTLLLLGACITGDTVDELLDRDGDGFKAVEGGCSDCIDCDDTDPRVHPDADEVCDGIDNNCSGDVDVFAIDASSTMYQDRDGDGFGDGTHPVLVCAGAMPAGTAAGNDDCDDQDASVNPAMTESTYNGIDDDCDLATVDDDLDGDGIALVDDCDDRRAALQDGDCPAPTIGAGQAFSCALDTNGAAECWGSGDAASPPTGVFVGIAAGERHACAWDGAGDVRCWGDDTDGQAQAPVGPFRYVTAGDTHTCGLRTDQTVECWGTDAAGEATPPTGRFVTLAAGPAVTCGIRPGGETAECWGEHYATVGARSQHVELDARLIAVGEAHACLLSAYSEAVECWGTPEQQRFAFSPDGPAESLVVGGQQSCILNRTGAAHCWDAAGATTAPTSAFLELAAGVDHVCGRTTDGLECWGNDEFGQASPPPQ